MRSVILFSIFLLGTTPRLHSEEISLVLENSLVRASIRRETGALTSVSIKGQEIALSPAISESVVTQTGGIQAINDLKPVAKQVAASPAFEAFLPRNPLIGHTPHGRIELPYYRPDRTDKLKLTRTYRLVGDQPVLEIAYRVSNTDDRANTFCLRLERRFSINKTHVPSLVPTVEGIQRSGLPYEYDMLDTWVAFTGKGQTIVATFDPATTSCLFHSPQNQPGGAMTTEITLQPGEEWKGSTHLYFLHGLKSIDDLMEDYAVSIALPAPPLIQILAETGKDVLNPDLGEFNEEDLEILGKKHISTLDAILPWPLQTERSAFMPEQKLQFAVRFYGLKKERLKVSCSVRRIVSRHKADLGTKAISIEPGRISEATFSFTPELEGTWLLQVEVEKGQKKHVVERPVVIDRPSGLYLPRRPEPVKRIGKEFVRFRKELFGSPGIYDPLAMGYPLTDNIKTEHLPFAKQLSGGPVRIMLVIPFRRAREAVELMQRLDCEMDSIVIGGHGYEGPGGQLTAKNRRPKSHGPAEEIRAIRRALARQPEVIVLGAAVWYWFPFDVQREIMRQVSEDGAGLIFVAPLYLPVDFSAKFKEALGGQLGIEPRIASFGKGQVAFRRGQAATPHYEGVFARTEESLESLSRTIIQLGRGGPPVEISMKKSATYDRTCSVTVNNMSKKPFTGKVEVRVWMNVEKTYPSAMYAAREERSGAKQAVTLKVGATKKLKLELHEVPHGVFNILAFVKDNEGNTVNWDSQTQRTDPPIDIKKLKASHGGVRLAPRFYRRDTAHISFEIQPRHELTEGNYRAFVIGFDRSGREILRARQPLTLAEKQLWANGADQSAETSIVKFEVPLSKALHRHFILRGGVELEGIPVGETRRPVLVDRKERFNKFRFVLLDNENYFPHHKVLIDDFGQGGYYGVAQIDGRGMSYGGFHGDPNAISREEAMAREMQATADAAKAEAQKKLDAVADLNRTDEDDEIDDLEKEIEKEIEKEESAEIEAKPKKPQIFTRADCYNNPEHKAIFREGMLKKIAGTSDGWPQMAYVDDEYMYGSLNNCQCEHCQTAFQNYLKKGYGSLERLNREWQTELKSFDEPKLMWFKNKESPPEQKDWPRAIDTLAYKAQQYHDTAVEIKNIVNEKVDPDFTIGASGVYKMERDWLTNGINHWLMASMGSLHSIYRDFEEWSSFAGRGSVFGWQSGYGNNYNISHQAWHPWFTLFQGRFFLGHFTSNGYPMASQDGTLHPGPAEFFKNWEMIRKGPGHLLLGHEVRDPIAIYWSGPSFYLCGVERWTKYGRDSGTLLRWMNHSIGRHMGKYRLRPYYLSYGHVEQGFLGYWGKPKVIIMNYCNAVSMKEIRVLRKFVEDGGTLVGGVDTATRTEHGYPWNPSPLDEVFGIKRVGGWRPVVTKGEGGENVTKVTVTFPGNKEPLSFLSEFISPNVESTTAKAHGKWGDEKQGGEVFFVNRFGKGTAVYLNYTITGPASGPTSEWAYRTAGVQPFAWTDSPARYTRFRDGETFYACLLPSYGQPPDYYKRIGKQTNVQLTEPRHVYESLEGRYLGKVENFSTDFSKRREKIFACLKYQATGLKLENIKPSKQGNDINFGAHLKVEGGAATGRHVFRVDVIKPDGMPQEILGYNQEAPKGQATIELPIAWNAPMGDWTVQVRDVATGFSAEQQFKVTR